ncbi:hypothetical protein NDA11_000525 [Ustilago hordei]|uniref:Uncharacterized protein n=1 Tax=Ustilago hordei TaxID=120017 RepID=I2FVN8_USTHO|nr:uncharacterized protein UHO2_04521 [Ustilago hordei]KAJ1042486.1 hypothetical protein NDA10_002752 [Ustilago hordei]KAJ1578104.1 hypothetical protein NDA12_004758 [Ustilago hordei]KAJ1578235.1 hypothetical protein NDA11_000525 [Ustilago hordei]KAJ1592349.1 hypothetical protein NDA15_000257 [Ustilago hordei]KAJ1595857.1 hypothetical protein NDA14_005040 [Ustilago hordei]
MSDHDYSAYEDFIQMIEGLISCLPDMLQSCFHRVLISKTYLSSASQDQSGHRMGPGHGLQNRGGWRTLSCVETRVTLGDRDREISV